ncbi:MAG: hypothetical protein ACI4XM_04845 [Candidatus Coprovivens sp.]
MKSESWIKMGFKILKLIILILFIGVMFYSSSNTKKYYLLDNYDFSQELGVSTVATKNEEEKPKPVEVSKENTNVLGANKYKGDLTGYAADCPACNGTLACKPKYDVYKNGVVTYPDTTYGDVRIVASSKNLKCGSIIKFNLKTISSESVYAIVLDRGVLGTDIDLLVETESLASKIVGRRTTTYEVLRSGW